MVVNCSVLKDLELVGREMLEWSSGSMEVTRCDVEQQAVTDRLQKAIRSRELP